MPNKDYVDYEFEDDDEIHFEKFVKSKIPKDKDRKKSLRDYRGKVDKRNIKEEKRNDIKK